MVGHLITAGALGPIHGGVGVLGEFCEVSLLHAGCTSSRAILAVPTLAVTLAGSSAIARRIRPAMADMSGSRETSAMTNSSPPARAMTDRCRQDHGRRAAVNPLHDVLSQGTEVGEVRDRLRVEITPKEEEASMLDAT